MRDHDGSSNRKCDAKNLEELFLSDSLLLALENVIRDAVVTTQDHRCHQTHHLLRFSIKPARLIGEGVNGKEALEGAIVYAKNALIHFFLKELNSSTRFPIDSNPFFLSRLQAMERKGNQLVDTMEIAETGPSEITILWS